MILDLNKHNQSDIQTGVYQILNVTNNKSYIGSAAQSFTIRWNRHIVALNLNRHHNVPLQRAWNKYGKDSFAFHILKICLPNECLTFEQDSINTIKPEYNIAKIAGSTYGVKLSAQTRAKMSLSKKGKPFSKERLAAMLASESYTGENNSMAKLTLLQVEEIRKLYQTGDYTQKQLGDKFYVTKEAIGSIVRNKTWVSKCETNFLPEVNKSKQGENNNKAKLTQVNVNKIRSLYNAGEYKQKDLAVEFNVTAGTINQIVNNKFWFDPNYKKKSKAAINLSVKQLSLMANTIDQLQKEYLHLTNVVLPNISLERGFPVKNTHCHQRICLDQLFQGCWYEFLVVGKIPAYRQLDVDQLQQLVDIAQSLVDGDLEHINLLNQQSLDWRIRRQHKSPHST